jgi:hypothetical protein
MKAWLESMKSLRAQSAGDVDFPPALQWARRPVWFSLQNLVLWGLGLPLGILAFAGLAWMAYWLVRERRLAESESLLTARGWRCCAMGGQPAGLGLDRLLLHLAVAGLEPDHALPAAHLPDAGDPGGLAARVRLAMPGSTANPRQRCAYLWPGPLSSC